MITIVFIETYKSGSSREAIKAAVEMGYYTVLYTNRKRPIQQRKQYSDVHEMHYHDLTDLDGLRGAISLLEIQGKKIKTIVSFIDSYVYIATLLAEEFCNSKVSSKSVFQMENKIHTRNALIGKPYNPYFTIFDHTQEMESFITEQENSLPLIVKMPMSAGSKDVYLVTDKHQLKTILLELQTTYPNNSILLEEYMEDRQFLIEAIVFDNKVEIIAVIEQEITKLHRFIVMGYSVLAEVPSDQYKELQTLLESLITTFELSYGCLHVELKCLKEGGWKVVEVNPRMSGGAMNQMVKAASGINLAKESLKVFLGEKPTLERQKNMFVFTQYLTVLSSGFVLKVTGKERASRCPGVVDVYVKPRKGARVSPPFSMGNRYAYVIAVGTTKEEARQYAKDSAKQIEFHLLHIKNE